VPLRGLSCAVQSRLSAETLKIGKVAAAAAAKGSDWLGAVPELSLKKRNTEKRKFFIFPLIFPFAKGFYFSDNCLRGYFSFGLPFKRRHPIKIFIV
jgi:hypothetical protein